MREKERESTRVALISHNMLAMCLRVKNPPRPRPRPPPAPAPPVFSLSLSCSLSCSLFVRELVRSGDDHAFCVLVCVQSSTPF